MDKKVVFALGVALIMIAALVPISISDDTEALTGDANLRLNSKHVILYLDPSDTNSFEFEVNLIDNTGPSAVHWGFNDLDDGDDVVTGNVVPNTNGTKYAVSAYHTGTVEIVAWTDDNNFASAVIVVMTSTQTAATEFNFYIQIILDSNSPYWDDFILPYGKTVEEFTAGFWIHVSESQVIARYGDGTVFNAINALQYYVDVYNDGVPEGEDKWDLLDSYGWLDSFLGMDMYPGDDGVWYYWAQYHAVTGNNGTSWAFNNYGLYDITTEEYSHIGLIFWASPSAEDSPAYPTA